MLINLLKSFYNFIFSLRTSLDDIQLYRDFEFIKRQKSVDSALNSNGSSAAFMESPPALVAPESPNCNKEVVAPIATIESTVSAGRNAVSSTPTLRALNNGSIRSSASKRYWTLLNQPVPEVNPALPNKQVECRIKEGLQTLESHQSPVSKEVAPIVTAELNNGSSRNSAIKRFWTFLNQVLLWVTTPALPYKQVGLWIQESPPTLESPQGPISKKVAPIDAVESAVLAGQNEIDGSAFSSHSIKDIAELTPPPSQSFAPKALAELYSCNKTSDQTVGTALQSEPTSIHGASINLIEPFSSRSMPETTSTYPQADSVKFRYRHALPRRRFVRRLV